MADAEAEGRYVPIEWQFPASLVSRYATNLVVQQGEHEFIISFFEIHLPMLLGLPEQRKATIDQLETVPAECVARLIVAAERMPEFVKVLQEQLEQYRSRRQTPE
jgi:hypothetical protein